MTVSYQGVLTRSVCPMHRATTNCYKARGGKAGEGVKGSSPVSGNRYPRGIGHEAVTVPWLRRHKAVGAQVLRVLEESPAAQVSY